MPLKVRSTVALPKTAGNILNPCYDIAVSPAAQLLELHGDSPSGATGWAAANKPVALPIVFQDSVTVKQLGVAQGTTATNNFDIGIYDTSFNRKVSAGSTACTGGGNWKWVDVTDTALAAGRYYVVVCVDSTSTQRIQCFNPGITAYLAGFGILDGAGGGSQFPLPDPLASMAAASATFAGKSIPFCAIGLRDPY